MKQSFFITASGTGIGKTLVTTALAWQLRQMGKTVSALKPIITGYDPADMESDTAQILKSCSLSVTPASAQTISPWRYPKPFAPAMAASRENDAIDDEALVSFCRDHENLTDILLVEGAGGVAVPVNEQFTTLDWMKTLGWPVILVGGSYLGAISHTLTALESLKSRGIPVQALVISESSGKEVPLDETAALIAKFMPPHVPVVKIPRFARSEEPWKQVPLISWICDPHA